MARELEVTTRGLLLLSKVTRRLSYANVMSTLCFFLLLGGGAYAVSKLPKNSVGSRQIKDGQVKNRDLRDGAVTSPKLADGSVSNSDLSSELRDQISGLESTVRSQQSKISGLETLLAGVSRQSVGGRDTLRFSGMNLQVINGAGATDTKNGLGNLIVGYDQQRPSWWGPLATRTGSHYLIVGDGNEWTGYGGIVSGYTNTASAPWATVLGGLENTASGQSSSVLGGYRNAASGNWSAVSGGQGNTASGIYSSVSAGSVNTAGGETAVVSGGAFNAATGAYSSVSGGSLNTASGQTTSILGGSDKTASANYSCQPACP